MAWFLNFYKCDILQAYMTDQWSCMCDDDCPHCGARHMSPYDSEELTTADRRGRQGIRGVLVAEKAEHDPDYRELAVSVREKRWIFLSADG